MSEREELDRLEELLVEQATSGLDAAGEAELGTLLERVPLDDPAAFERAAAALDLALTARAGGVDEPLPADLAARIEADASKYLPTPETRPQLTLVDDRPEPQGRPWLAASGWFAAAAALALFLWSGSTAKSEKARLNDRVAALETRAEAANQELLARNAELVDARADAAALNDALAAAERASQELEASLLAARDAAASKTSEYAQLVATAGEREAELLDRIATMDELLSVPSPSVRLERLLRNSDDVVRVPWSSTPDPLVANSGVSGEVIWSDSAQEGYMVFNAMRSNTELGQQFQLWIFSSSQSADTPVDGGVFDVATSTQRIVVPIDPKLAVEDPSLFAVTLEKPGGVVVSSRERLLLLAEV